MQLPSFTPKSLSFIETIDSDQQLFETLVKKSDDLISFFLIAADDEIWASKHDVFISAAINWATEKAYLDQLDYSDIKRLALIIQNHYLELKSTIPCDIKVSLNDSEFQENSLLLSAASPYLRRLLIRDCRDKSNHELILNQFSRFEYSPVHSFINTGVSFEVLTMGQDELIQVLKRLLPWQITGLLKIIETRLSKYLNDENIVEVTKASLQESWEYLSEHCANYLNHRYFGFSLKVRSLGTLSFEFYNFDEDALKYFDIFKSFITKIICKGLLPENTEFGQILKISPKLIALDISETKAFSQYYENIPNSVKEINLSDCAWISNETVKLLSKICYQIEDLSLSNNIHLKYSFWGELLKFKNLKKLELAYCRQIQNNDLNLILESCKGLSDLNLQGCEQITNDGFHDLAKKLIDLTYLNLSSCNLTDVALIEISASLKKLNSLDISNCDQITEKGLLSLTKNSLVLQELNISRCNISFSALQEMKRLRPTLQIYP